MLATHAVCWDSHRKFLKEQTDPVFHDKARLHIKRLSSSRRICVLQLTIVLDFNVYALRDARQDEIRHASEDLKYERISTSWHEMKKSGNGTKRRGGI